MTGIDLRELMHERSESPTDEVLDHVRLAGVRARVVDRRRRRVAVGAALAVIAIAGAAGWVALPDRAAPPPPVGAATRKIEGFPEYANGARVVAAAAVRLPTLMVTIRFVPRVDRVVVFTRCETERVDGQDVTLTTEIKVDGKRVLFGKCHGFVDLGPVVLAKREADIGMPATVAMTITGAQTWSRGSDKQVPAVLPTHGTFGLALAEQVTFGEYEFPPRPAHLKPMDRVLDLAGDKGAVLLRADPADPLRPLQREISWRTLSSIEAYLQTPGELYVTIDSNPVGVHQVWDYSLDRSSIPGDRGGRWERDFKLRLHAGQKVMLRVEPRYVTGDWAVLLMPA